MAKRYNPKIITELSESAFFHSPAASPQPAEAEIQPAATGSPDEPTNQSSIVQPIPTAEYSQRSNVRTNERSQQRRKIRHTFDIFADQLMALREIALKRENETGDRVLLGELAQEALDMLISKEKGRG